MREVPIMRVLNYELMFILGICLGYQVNAFELKSALLANPGAIRDILLMSIAILFAFLFAMIINNLEDIEIDKISNADRAVVAGKIDRGSYRQIATACLLLASIYSALVATQAIFFILLFMGIYFIYSAYPLRMKRITIFSKVALSINSLFLILLGFWVVRHDFTAMMTDNTPMLYLVSVFVLFTLAANFIDLKDTAGDKAAGILTCQSLSVLVRLNMFVDALSS